MTMKEEFFCALCLDVTSGMQACKNDYILLKSFASNLFRINDDNK